MRQKILGARRSIPSACLAAALFSFACDGGTLGDRSNPTTTPNSTSAAALDGHKPSAAIEVEYEVPPGIEAGSPFEVELKLRTRQAGESLVVELSGMPGLAILEGRAARFEPAEANRDYAIRVLAVADASGTYYLGVVAKVSTIEKSDARAFSIAIPVGHSEPSASPLPMARAVGQSVESMPAQESSDESGGTPTPD